MAELSIISVLAATIIGMVLGGLWYSPLLFGNAWMKCIGKTPETLGSQTAPMIGSIIASAMMAIGVSLLFYIANVTEVKTAVSIGAILGLLVIFPALLSDNLFCGWGNQLLLIQAGYRAISVFLMCLATYFT